MSNTRRKFLKQLTRGLGVFTAANGSLYMVGHYTAK